MNMLNTVLIISVLIFFFLLGWIVNEVYDYNNYQKQLEGIYMKNANYSYVKNRITSLDPFGDWVCVNVRGMDFERGYEVCKHEVGHEIFAEFCEEDDNINKCINITK